jgi:O-antigen/teichoic acid export membrane protein
MATATIREAVVSEAVAVETPSLRTSFKWMVGGYAFYAACQWGMLSTLAKAGNATIVGQFALGLAISAPVFMFTNLNLRGAQATDARSDFDFADYFTLRVLASLAGVLTVATIVGFLNYGVATRMVIILLGVSKAIESLGDAIAGLLQKVERLHQVAISVMLRGALSIAAFGITFLVLRSLVAAVCALVLSWSAVLLGYDLWRGAAALGEGKRFLRFHPAQLRRLLVHSAPLGVVMTLISLNANIPRYLLVKYLGEAELGIFASMAYMLQALYLVVYALGESAAARLARMFALGDVCGFRRVTGKLVWIGVAILLLGAILSTLLGRPLLTILYRSEYGKDLSVFVIMMIGGGVTAIGYFLGYGINAARRFWLQVPVIALSTVMNAAMTAVLAPRLGLMGAALALLSAALVHVFGNALALRYALGQIGPPAAT